MQDQQTRAKTALELVRAAIRDDDQDSFDFLCETIRRERLFLNFSTDAGERITSMEVFIADLKTEAEAV